jgi:hypothetical protein
MNVAISIGTLLLGGWVLNTPVVELTPEQMDQAPFLQEPMQEAAAPSNAGSPRRSKFQDPLRQLPRDEAQQFLRDQEKSRPQLNPDGTQKRKGPAAPEVSQQSKAPKRPAWVLPPVPTDPLRANSPGMPTMPLPPTVREGDLDMGPPAADPFTSPTAVYSPDLPVSRRAYSPRSAESMSTYDMADKMRDDISSRAHQSFNSSPAPAKAFSGARPFSSGVSPYMNLFRNDTAGGTIDNYSTFVRPALDQRSMNQQFNMDMYGLERAQRIQNAAMQRLGREYNSRDPQAIGTPQFYRNYGNFYPGANGQGNYGQGPYGPGGY